jgi:hypothetical protein
MAATIDWSISYQLERIFPIEQHYELLDPDLLEKEGGEFDFSFYWNWYVEGERRIAVMFGIRATGGKETPEEVRAAAVAVFSVVSPTPDVPLQIFVQRDAVSIIVPFLNDIFVSLTARSLTGTLRILPFEEIAKIPEAYPFEESSGAKLLSTDKNVAKAFGMDLVVPPTKGRKKKQAQRPPEAES